MSKSPSTDDLRLSFVSQTLGLLDMLSRGKRIFVGVVGVDHLSQADLLLALYAIDRLLVGSLQYDEEKLLLVLRIGIVFEGIASRDDGGEIVVAKVSP